MKIERSFKPKRSLIKLTSNAKLTIRPKIEVHFKDMDEFERI